MRTIDLIKIKDLVDFDDSQDCCKICGGEAIDDEKYNMVICKKNKNHMASNWDYEWFSIDG